MAGPAEELALGLATGIAFGFLLQKGRVSKHDVVVGQFLLRDWTVVKILATAVAVGAVGVWTMVGMGLTHVAPAPAQLAGVLVGAVLFGVGMVVLGYCPGTAIAAAGEGKRDARVGVVGMAAGAFLFVITHDVVAPLQRTMTDLGPMTWPALTRSPPWPWIAGVVALALVLYAVSRARHRRTARGRP